MADRIRVGIRIPKGFKELIDRYLKSDPSYFNISDFARSAFREKIIKDAPWLYEEIVKSEKDSPPEEIVKSEKDSHS